jgi:hypothetical protein
MGDVVRLGPKPEHGRFQAADGHVYQATKDRITGKITLGKVLFSPGVPARPQRQFGEADTQAQRVIPLETGRSSMVDGIRTLHVDERAGSGSGRAGLVVSPKARMMRYPGPGWVDHS